MNPIHTYNSLIPVQKYIKLLNSLHIIVAHVLSNHQHLWKSCIRQLGRILFTALPKVSLPHAMTWALCSWPVDSKNEIDSWYETEEQIGHYYQALISQGVKSRAVTFFPRSSSFAHKVLLNGSYFHVLVNGFHWEIGEGWYSKQSIVAQNKYYFCFSCANLPHLFPVAWN